MARLYRTERAPFVAAFLSANPRCQLQLNGCTGRATTVNEVIRRSHSGAIYPGQPGKRETAYMPACISCHSWLTEHPKEAKEQGWEVR